MKNITIACYIFISFFTISNINADEYFPFNELAGKWEWSIKENPCKGEPFAEIVPKPKEGKILFITKNGSKIGDNETTYTNLTYILLEQGLLGVGDNRKIPFIKTELLEETRKDESGNLVQWDLILFEKDKFCWRRSDWKLDECTAHLLKCSE